MDDPKNATTDLKLDGIAPAMRDAVRAYAELVKELCDGQLHSLAMTGAVLDESFAPTETAAESVLVLQGMDLGLLRRMAERGPSLGKKSIAAPLVMTPQYIASSLDTFPLEFIEIQQRHATVLGDDPFKNLAFEDRHVRLECERELKRFLIALRQGLLASAGRTAALGAVQREAAAGLLRTLRGMLWLKGSKSYQPQERLIAGIEELLKSPLRGLRGAMALPAPTGFDAGFEALYADVEALSVAVDGW